MFCFACCKRRKFSNSDVSLTFCINLTTCTEVLCTPPIKEDPPTSFRLLSGKNPCNLAYAKDCALVCGVLVNESMERRKMYACSSEAFAAMFGPWIDAAGVGDDRTDCGRFTTSLPFVMFKERLVREAVWRNTASFQLRHPLET